VGRGGQLGQTVVLEHVQQRGLAGIVQAEEEDLAALAVQAQVRQHVEEPVEHPHGWWVAAGGGRGFCSAVCFVNTCLALSKEGKKKRGRGAGWRIDVEHTWKEPAHRHARASNLASNNKRENERETDREHDGVWVRRCGQPVGKGRRALGSAHTSATLIVKSLNFFFVCAIAGRRRDSTT